MVRREEICYLWFVKQRRMYAELGLAWTLRLRYQQAVRSRNQEKLGNDKMWESKMGTYFALTYLKAGREFGDGIFSLEVVQRYSQVEI